MTGNKHRFLVTLAPGLVESVDMGSANHTNDDSQYRAALQSLGPRPEMPVDETEELGRRNARRREK
jgi:hypothetical protein